MNENKQNQESNEQVPVEKRTFSGILASATVNIIATCLAACLVAIAASLTFKFIMWLF